MKKGSSKSKEEKKVTRKARQRDLGTVSKGSIAKIKVLGMGGAGGNAVDFMKRDSDSGDIEFIAMNTDAQDLNSSDADIKIQLGEKITKGLGAGANPEIGKLGAEEDKDKIKSAIVGTDLLFITAGMGGGTGTGSAPVVARIAKEMGILTVAVVTKPFNFEGLKRRQNSMAGINELSQYVDTLVVIPNEKLFELPNKGISLVNAFESANGILKIGIRGISDLITKQGYINLDFADIRSIMSESGVAMLGFGYAEGEDRAKIAAEQALNSPLLERPITGARKILLNISGDPELGLNEASQIAEMVSSATGDTATDVIFGTVIDSSLNKGIKVTIIATDFMDGPDPRVANNSNRVELGPEKRSFQDSSREHVESSSDYSDVLDIPAFLRRNRK
ncbi:MAG TPA: cell division protein FtsZ [Fusobacteria bacterium]|nr:cell division protein FtsZ [Fusobacteriota bacterium]|tara:strand:+ start:2921 stop:4093 length:1173 start_codon:yes stop_codon:yes gene_type:complete